MGLLGNLMNATAAGASAFREAMLNADPQSGRAGLAFDPGSWDRWEARQVRYDLYWSLYQNNAYRDLVHAWAARYKTAYGAYKHVRHLYNPAYRLGEFWASHLWGGPLDAAAGDGCGDEAASALPILADNEALRPGIARLWRDSRWQVYKDLCTRWGSVLGDVAIRGVADTTKGECRMEVVHPGHLKWVDRDGSGEVTGYILQKWVPDPRDADIRDASPTVDPRAAQRRVIYYEKCYLDGRDVVYEASLDGRPWGGDAGDGRTVRPYGFVPLEVIHHETIGLDWGQNCFHAGLSRFLEVDDQASCAGDHNRRAQRAPTLIAGAKGPAELRAATADRSGRTPQQDLADPEPYRSQELYLYSPSADTRAHSLAAHVDVSGMIAHIASLNADIEKHFPELLADTGNLTGTVTAEAIRNARSVAASRVQSKRPAYDDALSRIQKKLLVMGSIEGFEGFADFSPAALAAGRLDHQVGHRPVFEVDPLDRLEEDALRWANACAARTAGVPLALILERDGWSPEDLARLEAARAADPQAEAAVTLTQPRPQAPDAGAEI